MGRRRAASLLTLAALAVTGGCLRQSDAEASKALPIEIKEEHPVNSPGAAMFEEGHRDAELDAPAAGEGGG